MSILSDALPFLGWIDLQGYKKAMKKISKELDSILAGWLEEHRARRATDDAAGAKDNRDFIDAMLSLQEQQHFTDFPFDNGTSIKSTCWA